MNEVYSLVLEKCCCELLGRVSLLLFIILSSSQKYEPNKQLYRFSEQRLGWISQLSHQCCIPEHPIKIYTMLFCPATCYSLSFRSTSLLSVFNLCKLIVRNEFQTYTKEQIKLHFTYLHLYNFRGRRKDKGFWSQQEQAVARLRCHKIKMKSKIRYFLLKMEKYGNLFFVC
jgi:hypothetical protein